LCTLNDLLCRLLAAQMLAGQIDLYVHSFIHSFIHSFDSGPTPSFFFYNGKKATHLQPTRVRRRIPLDAERETKWSLGDQYCLHRPNNWINLLLLHL
jgi:hypothetical protein